MADYRSSLNILRQLGISQTPPEGLKRVIIVIDWPESGGTRVRDVASLQGHDFLEVRWDIRRQSRREMVRTGVIVPATDGRPGMRKIRPSPPILPPSSNTEG